MGTKVASVRNYIYVEGSQFRNAVSEDLLQRSAATNNFILDYEMINFQFGIAKTNVNVGNPSYASIGTPFTGFGTIEAFPTNAQITGIELVHSASGSSGTSEIDIKWASTNSGSFASIFSTTPKCASTAPSNAQWDTFGNAATPTGCTVPVLSKTTFNKGDVLRCDIISTQAGNCNGFTLQIYFQPI